MTPALTQLQIEERKGWLRIIVGAICLLAAVGLYTSLAILSNHITELARFEDLAGLERMRSQRIGKLALLSSQSMCNATFDDVLALTTLWRTDLAGILSAVAQYGIGMSDECRATFSGVPDDEAAWRAVFAAGSACEVLADTDRALSCAISLVDDIDSVINTYSCVVAVEIYGGLAMVCIAAIAAVWHIRSQEIADLEKKNAWSLEFVRFVCHEIRNPLNFALATVRDSLDEGRDIAVEDMKEILRVSTRAVLVLDNVQVILQGSRKARSRASVVPVNYVCDDAGFSPGALARSVAADLQPLIDEGSSLQVLEDDDVRGIFYLGSAWALRLALQNIVANALSHTTCNGVTVAVTVAVKQGPTFEVINTGIGIEPEELKHISVVLGALPKSGPQPYGLGLLVVRQLLEKMAGTVTIRSPCGPGGGTTSVLALSLKSIRGTAEAHAGKTNTSTEANGCDPSGLPGGLRVLLVDDARSNRKLLRSILERHSSFEGLDWIIEERSTFENLTEGEAASFGLCIFDEFIAKSTVTGSVFTRRMRQAGYDTPIIICSANCSVEDRSAYIAAGAHNALPKPMLRPQEVAEILASVLTQSQHPFEHAPGETRYPECA